MITVKKDQSRLIWNLFEEGDIGKKQRDHNQGEGNGYFDVDILDVYFGVFHKFCPASFLNKTDATSASIPELTLMLNIHSLSFGSLDCIGTINAAPNQPADRLMNRSEKAINQREAEFSTKSNLTYFNVEGRVE